MILRKTLVESLNSKFSERRENLLMEARSADKVFFDDDRNAQKWPMDSKVVSQYQTQHGGKLVAIASLKNSKSYDIIHLFQLSEEDKDFVSNITTRPGEHIVRMATRNSMAGGLTPIVKINWKEGRIYFNKDEDKGEVRFETSGEPVEWMRIRTSRLSTI